MRNRTRSEVPIHLANINIFKISPVNCKNYSPFNDSFFFLPVNEKNKTINIEQTNI